jgi:hypothetical protein
LSSGSIEDCAGACGCGTADTDVDGDGLPVCSDNCRGVANPGQADADHDGIGDDCDMDADNDFIVDVDDDCPNASAYDRDLDHDGCKDDLAAIAAFLRAQVAELEDGTNGDPVTLKLLQPALRKLLRAADVLDKGKVVAAVRGLRAAIKSLQRAVSRGLVVGEHHVVEVASVARVLALLQIDAAQATPGADPEHLANAIVAYDQGVSDLAARLYLEAIEYFRTAALQATRAL